MRKVWFISIFLISTAVVSYLFFQHQSVQTITYFPIDPEESFTKAQTKISAKKEQPNHSYSIDWASHSNSNTEVYLRQDVSLLFENGRLKGVASKWKEDHKTIQLEKQLQGKSSNHYQSISFHHGEIHDPNGQIKGMQHMSDAELYVVDAPDGQIESFSEPANQLTAEWKDTLDLSTKQQLLDHWNQLMNHYQIDKTDYKSIPLTTLSRYNEKNLPNMTQEETDQVIGRLWEGLYKNYIVPVSSGKSDTSSSFIPMVLLAKDKSHLLVLYQLDGEQQKLIQQL